MIRTMKTLDLLIIGNVFVFFFEKFFEFLFFFNVISAREEFEATQCMLNASCSGKLADEADQRLLLAQVS